MSSNDFTSVITDMIAQDMMTHFKDLMKRVLFSFTSELSKTHKISVEEVILIWNKALPQLAYEVHMPVQETKVSPSSTIGNGSNEEEDTGCQFVLTRGKNKGDTCGKKNVKGSHFCTTHNKKSDEPKQIEKENKEKEVEKENKKEDKEVEKQTEKEKSCECKYILTRGKNKGEKCGKKTVKDVHYCATHNKKEESDSEGEKEDKQRKRKDKKEEKVEEVIEEVEEKVEEEVEDNIEKEKKQKKNHEEKIKEVKEKVEKKEDKVEVKEKKNKKKEVKQDDTAEKAKQLEQKLNEQKQKDENELKLKKIEEEKKNIGVDMAKNILQNLNKDEPVSISVMETQTQNAETEEQEDDEEDTFTYEKCKKQILINPKLNEEGELEFSMTKKNLEKFINKKVSSSQEQYKVSVNIFNKGMNIFYEEDGKKEQKKLLKFRFTKYHSVINDYLSSL